MSRHFVTIGLRVALVLALGSIYLVGRLQGLNYAEAHKPPTEAQTYRYLLTHDTALTDAWCHDRIND